VAKTLPSATPSKTRDEQTMPLKTSQE